MDYLKTPNQLNWTNGEQLYPGVAEQVFDPKGINAPYLIEDEKVGYCDIAYFWLTCQPDDDFFQQLIQLPHQPGSITDQIHKKKQSIIKLAFSKPFRSSELVTAKAASKNYQGFRSTMCSNIYTQKMMINACAGFTSIVDVVYKLISQPGRYLITTIYQNKIFGEKFQERKHCFAVYHTRHQKHEPHTIRVFDWRFGCYQFTNNHSTKLHLLLSALANYYVGTGPNSTFVMSVNQARIAKEDWKEFIAEYQTKFFPSST